jgi:hypothetical protein
MGTLPADLLKLARDPSPILRRRHLPPNLLRPFDPTSAMFGPLQNVTKPAAYKGLRASNRIAGVAWERESRLSMPFRRLPILRPRHRSRAVSAWRRS